MKTVKIALDWTPNSNHIGILVAKELGFYKQFGIDLVILDPLSDNYATTPGKKLELDLADFVLAPFETVISLNNKQNQVDAIAVFAILQEDISSIASLKSSGLESPRALDGKIYASYRARYEDKIVEELVKSDAGKGIFNIVYPDKLGIWNTLLDGKADATWIFNNWEGVEAESKSIELNKWSLKNFSIPYGYSPVIIANRNNLSTNKILYSNFIAATRKGYLHSQENHQEVIAILKSYVTPYDQVNIDLDKALQATISYFGDHKTCGFMNPDRVDSFLKWLIENKLENPIIREQELFTNELFHSI